MQATDWIWGLIALLLVAFVLVVTLVQTGVLHVRRRYSMPEMFHATDAEALASDWQAVGGDFRAVGDDLDQAAVTMMSSGPTSPKEALAHIQQAAAEGDVYFDDDKINATLDAEIQRIFRTIYQVLHDGKPPKRPIWAADHANIGWVLPCDDAGKVTEEGHAALAVASERLGIALSATDLWSDAALRLRDRSKPPAAAAEEA